MINIDTIITIRKTSYEINRLQKLTESAYTFKK